MVGVAVHKNITVRVRVLSVEDNVRDIVQSNAAFKVFDGQVHAVEAFIRILPIEKRKGGWD